MQIIFTRWCLTPSDRTPVSVDPTRVDVTEHYSLGFTSYGVDYPAATKIIMRNKQEYLVEGALVDVVKQLNGSA